MTNRNQVVVSRPHLWLVLLLLIGCVRAALTQATATASASGGKLSVGGTYSDYQIDYGRRDLAGYSIYADFERTRHWGAEFEARVLRHNQEVGTHETTFLIGPRFNFRRKWFNPYAKVLVGEGKFHFPYNYAEGSYFVLAPGAGLDVPLGSSRFVVRVVDFEYQSWPNFSFSGLNPYGVSAGFAVHIH